MKSVKMRILVIMLIAASDNFAQYMEWLSTGVNLQMEIDYASMDQKQNLVVVGDFNSLNADGSIVSFGPNLIDSGKNKKLLYTSMKRTMISYTSEGAISWVFSFHEEYNHIRGITHDSKGQLLVLIYVEGFYDAKDVQAIKSDRYEEDEYKEERKAEEEAMSEEDADTVKYYGILNDFSGKDDPDYFLSEGFHVFYLSAEGKFVKEIPHFAGEALEMDIEEFKITPTDGFFIYGTVSKDFVDPEDPTKTFKAGGDGVMVFQKSGDLLWSDVISCAGKATCSSYSNARSACMSQDGTLYLTGAFKDSVRLSTGELLKVDLKKTDKTALLYESYLIAYSPQGKINWFKQSGTKVMIHQLAATNNQVFLSYALPENKNQAFQFETDTTQRKKVVIASFSNQGTNLWSVSEGSQRIQSMEIKDKKLYVYGSTNYSISGAQIGTYSMKKRECSYLSTYDFQGKFQQVKPLPFHHDRDETLSFLFLAGANDVYIVTQISYSGRVPLKVLDSLFGDLESIGRIGVIGKLKY